ncbi:type IV secretory system conjugative DNA transfer family protein [Corynebacterium sp. CCM 9203]|uniref:type IV secretory system conjugative DNA transfer family protein n=1 Tax=Corynebacterium sp. CCM 9203 TaxID=3057615 RepID=UPI003525A03A
MTIRRADDTRGGGGMRQLYAVLAIGAVVLMAWSCIALAFWLNGEAVPLNPMAAIIEAISGIHRPPRTAWIFATIWAVIVVTGTAFWVVVRGRGGATARRNTEIARTMSTPGELRDLTGRGAQEKAARLYSGASAKDPGSLGLVLGRTVAKPHTDIWMSWEDTAVIFAGQRMGKTQSYVTTSILSAPGPCLATANKRDVVDLTRLGREQKGRVWVFDLQAIASDGAAAWWWNPLGMIRDINDARKLADYFASAAVSDDARQDAYFTTASQDLLAYYIFAAALADGDLLHVWEWLKNDTDNTPAQILALYGEPAAASAVTNTINLAARQKDGVFAMASNLIAVLSSRRYSAAVTPAQRVSLSVAGTEIVRTPMPSYERQNREQFDPLAFVESTDTLYALSVDGADSPAALTTALAGQIFDAAQQVARMRVGGRLPTPFVGVLDEAANVVRLRNLPALYSYAGSQGIVLLTFLQSRSQARRVWGDDGIRAMVESSNFVVYGGGIKDTQFLREISDLIGDMRVQRSSTSVGAQTSYTTQYEKQAIMTVDQLAALPSSQAVVLSSGHRATLTTKIFWRESRFAGVVTESLERQEERGYE